jgi:hypothetical protein
VLGSPGKPLTREAHLAKFSANAAAALQPLSPTRIERLIATIDRLEDVADVRTIADLVTTTG